MQVALDDPNLGTASIALGGHAAGDVDLDREIGRFGAGDVLIGNTNGNTIEGLDGDDKIYGLDDDDTLLGGDDNDDVIGHEGNDTIDGGFGNDFMSGDERIDTVSFESWDPTGVYIPEIERIRIQLNEGSVQGIARATCLHRSHHGRGNRYVSSASRTCGAPTGRRRSSATVREYAGGPRRQRFDPRQGRQRHHRRRHGNGHGQL